MRNHLLSSSRDIIYRSWRVISRGRCQFWQAAESVASRRRRRLRFISSALSHFHRFLSRSSLLDFFSSAFADASIRESLQRSPPRDLENDVSGSPKPADEIGMIDGVSFVRVIRLHYTSSCAFRLYVCTYVGVATCRVAFPLPFAYSATPPPALDLSWDLYSSHSAHTRFALSVNSHNLTFILQRIYLFYIFWRHNIFFRVSFAS